MKFKKNDKNKPKLTLLPKEPLCEIAQIIEYGAGKYGKDNWKEAKGEDLMRYIDATYRHLMAAETERYDKESGFQHLAHAACNLIFLLELIND